MDKKKIAIIIAAVGGGILLIAAIAIFVGVFADRPRPSAPTQPATYTATPTVLVATQTLPPTAATVPPAPSGNLPLDAEVMAIFKATRFSKTFRGQPLNADEWLVYLPINTTITVPAGWIANTEPYRWSIIGAPAGYAGTNGEILSAGTVLTALTNDDELYVRFLR